MTPPDADLLITKPDIVAAPMADLVLLVAPSARPGSVHNHVAGSVTGGVATYSDLHAYVWYRRGVWTTVNTGRRGLRRVHRGGEDSHDRQAH